MIVEMFTNTLWCPMIVVIIKLWLNDSLEEGWVEVGRCRMLVHVVAETIKLLCIVVMSVMSDLTEIARMFSFHNLCPNIMLSTQVLLQAD